MNGEQLMSRSESVLIRASFRAASELIKLTPSISMTSVPLPLA